MSSLTKNIPISIYVNNVNNVTMSQMTTKEELREEDKPVCFGCYGYSTCLKKVPAPSMCVWSERCYNSQRDY
jgi:hypothetical protein